MIEKQIPPLVRQDLLGYFVDAATPRSEWLLGMEFECLGFDAATNERIPYAGRPASVQNCLSDYRERRGGDPVYEGEHLIGLDGDWGTVSLEPGGQVEWSSRPRSDLASLARDLAEHIAGLDAVGQRRGIRWLELAMDPTTPLSDVPWMPKARYKILAPYLGARGRLAHRMMTQTASIQCAFDHDSPEDWSRKFRAAALLGPVAVAMFANSPQADGADTGYRSFRQAIWRETDPDRCGLPAVVFEQGFDMERWLDWVLDTPAIFLHRGRGLVPAGGVPFRELMQRSGCHAVSLEDWKLQLSAIFTEVRAYSYIEVRSADLQPRDTIMAVPAFWTGILYDDQALGGALELGRAHDSHEQWNEAMRSASRDGLGGRAAEHDLRELARQALALAVGGLRRQPRFVGDLETALRPLRLLARRLSLPDVPA